MSGNLPVIRQRTDSRKDAKIAKKRMNENVEELTLQFSCRVGWALAILASLREEIWIRLGVTIFPEYKHDAQASGYIKTDLLALRASISLSTGQSVSPSRQQDAAAYQQNQGARLRDNCLSDNNTRTIWIDGTAERPWKSVEK
jgi:hypothetical protein